jgi:hypothetical protein
MSDVTCPYCGKDQEINHDDGYGYEEDGDYEQECTDCYKSFKFTTSISFSYTVSCQDGDHDFEPFGPKHPGMFQCTKCDFYEKR